MTKQILLTLDQVLADMRELLAERGPSFVYQPPAGDSCVYFTRDGQPSCAVGWILSKHGITRDDLAGWNDMTPVSVLVDTRVIILDGTGDERDRAYEALVSLQDRQDQREPYGEAITSVFKQIEEEL